MTGNKERMVRLIVTVCKALVFLIVWAVLASVIPIPSVEPPAVWRFWAEWIPFACIAAVTLLFYLAERRRIAVHILPLSISTIVKSCLLGLAWIGAATGVLLAVGAVRIGQRHTVTLLWLWIVSAFVNTVMQELLVRGYVYQMIRKTYHTAAAAVVTTALFTLAHGGALEAGVIPTLNIVVMSLFMTALLEDTGTLAAPICVHFLWNSVGGIVLGGVSLADDYPHVFDVAFSGNPLLSGGSCKIEGSIVVLLLNMVCTFGIVAWNKRCLRT